MNQEGKRSPLQITTGIVIKVLSTQLFPANVSVSIPEITLCKNLFPTDDFLNDSNQHVYSKVAHAFHYTKEEKASKNIENTNNLSNLNESGLKRSEQRAVCSEGKVMQKISNKHLKPA